MRILFMLALLASVAFADITAGEVMRQSGMDKVPVWIFDKSSDPLSYVGCAKNLTSDDRFDMGVATSNARVRAGSALSKYFNDKFLNTIHRYIKKIEFESPNMSGQFYLSDVVLQTDILLFLPSLPIKEFRDAKINMTCVLIKIKKDELRNILDYYFNTVVFKDLDPDRLDEPFIKSLRTLYKKLMNVAMPKSASALKNVPVIVAPMIGVVFSNKSYPKSKIEKYYF